MSEALSAGTVSLGVKPDTKGFGAKLAEGVRGESGGVAGLGSELGGKLLAGLGAIGIAVGVGEFIKKGVEEYSAADALNAQFAAGLTSTNNAANLSVKGMDDLAKSISGYSGQSYASIGKTEQVLQTFTNLRNVGPDKIFDQATVAAANMAAKLGGDASASAIQLGKALNDPVKGMAALRRVGVAFTQSQQDQIKAMVASGDTLGAQKVMLAELTTEFGGAAKAAGQTLPGEIARSKVAFGELSKAVVGGVMPFVVPVIEAIANAVNRATPFVEKFSDAFREKVSAGLKAAQPAFDAIGGVLKTVGASFEKLWPSIKPLIPQVIGLASALSPVHLIFEAIKPMLPQLISTFSHLASTLAGALGSALKVILPAITQVAGLLAGELGSVLKMLVPVILQLVQAIGPVLGEVFKAAMPLIVLVAGFVGQLLKAVMPLVPVILSLVEAFVPLLAPLIQLVGAILTPLIQLLSAILGPVMDLVTGLVQFLVPAVQMIITVITWLITNVIAGAKIEFKILGDVIGNIGNVIGTVFGAIGGIIKGAFNGVVDFVKGIFNTIIDVVNGIIHGINAATSIGAAIGIHIGKIPNLPHLADSGTVLPTPGGTIVRVAEGGKAESVVDTGQLNNLMRAATNAATKDHTPPAKPAPVALDKATISALADALASRVRVHDRMREATA